MNFRIDREPIRDPKQVLDPLCGPQQIRLAAWFADKLQTDW